MPMRAELLKLSGDGTGLAFTTTGKGAFRVTLSNAKPFANYTFLLPAGVTATKVSDTAVDLTTASAVTVYSVVVSSKSLTALTATTTPANPKPTPASLG